MLPLLEKNNVLKSLALGLGCAVALAVVLTVLQTLFPGVSHEETLIDPVTDPSWEDVMLVMPVPLILWAHSALARSSDHLIRRNIIIITAMLIGWVLLVPLKYGSSNDLFMSMAWYAYYVPLCMIPVLGLECALRAAGLDAGERMGRVIALAKVVSVLLIVLVCTNNLHHQVFQFSFSTPNWTADYSYGWGYWLILSWLVLVMSVFVVVLARAAHRTRLRAVLGLLGLLAVVALYTGLYVADMLPPVLMNMTFAVSLLIVATIELCLRVGLLPSYGNYNQVFAQLPFDVRIFNKQKTLELHTKKAENVTNDELLACLPQGEGDGILTGSGSFYMENKQVTGNFFPLSGGMAVVAESIAELNRRTAELEQRQEALRSQTNMLKADYQVQSQLLRLQSEAELYQEIEEVFTRATQRIQLLLDTLTGTETPESCAARQRSLFQVKLLLSYCKRQGGLILMGRDEPLFDQERLALALSETASDLRTAGVECAVLAEAPRALAASTTSAFYDCMYNFAALALLLDQPSMLVFVRSTEGERATLRLALESSTLQEIPQWAIDDLRKELSLVAAECSLVSDGDMLHLTANELAEEPLRREEVLQ